MGLSIRIPDVFFKAFVGLSNTTHTRRRRRRTQVMNEGTIKLVNARHPVLLLRGKTPVGNDMSLDGSMQALILTGPNAGMLYSTLSMHVCMCERWACMHALAIRQLCVRPAWKGEKMDARGRVVSSPGALRLSLAE